MKPDLTSLLNTLYSSSGIARVEISSGRKIITAFLKEGGVLIAGQILVPEGWIVRLQPETTSCERN